MLKDIIVKKFHLQKDLMKNLHLQGTKGRRVVENVYVLNCFNKNQTSSEKIKYIIKTFKKHSIHLIE